MAEELLTMFGKAYNTVGSANSNLILQTRGDIKIRWGNKFIDLIKNGKINVETDTLKTIGSKDQIYKDGIYLVDNNGTYEVWAQIDGNIVNLAGEVGTTYVSYVKEQKVNREGKFIALSNIGIYYNTYDEAVADGVQAGVIYVLDQQAFFHYKDGKLVKYQQNVDIPNPLKIGQITIDGTENTIISDGSLELGSSGTTYISFRNDVVKILKSLVSNDIKSPDYTHKASGYAIYRGDDNLSCLEIDNILIRNKLEYLNIIDIKYSDLVNLVENNGLIKGKKYRITDFQDEWEITQEYVDNTDPSTPVKYKYYWPITLTAETNNSFEEYGYFCDNEEWIIKYDLNFCYFVNAYMSQDMLIKNYTKGRITYLRDEFGNEANYDFKHRLFKHTSDSDDPRTWFFTYSAPNPDYLTNEDDPLEYSNVHQKLDYSLSGKIVNNVLYIKEPSFKKETIIVDSYTLEEEKLQLYEEYIIFPNCTAELYPHDNSILSSNGKYVITKEFYDNYIKGLIQNVTEPSQYNFDFDFTGNTADIIYIKHEYVAPTIEIDPETEEEIEVIHLPQTSNKEVKFKTDKEYRDNTFKDVTDSIFDDNLIGNSFKNVTSVKATGKLIDNFFEKDLLKVHFTCLKIEGNNFLDEIDTDDQPDTYKIGGVIIKDNFFHKITKTYFLSNLEIKGSTFGDITFVDSVYTEFNGIITDTVFGNITGVKFVNGSEILKSQFQTVTTNTNYPTTQFKGKIKECKFGPIISTLFDTNSNLYKVVTYDEILDAYPTINVCEFKHKMENVSFSQNITFVTFKEYINRSYFFGTITGLVDAFCQLNKISFTDVKGNITEFNMNDSTISNSTFNVISKVNLIETSSIQNSTFTETISKIDYQGTITKSDFHGNISGGENPGIIKCDITMSTFEEAITEPDISHVGSKIEYCTFLRSITKLKSDDIVSLINDYFYLSINDLLVNGTISYCKFNGAVTGVIIDGTGAISNCSFMGLSKDGSDKLKVIGALSNTDIHDDITPKSAEWVEKVDTEGESDEYIRIIDLPGAFTLFEISSSAVPKLAGRNKKDCYLRSVTKNGTTKKIFIVSLGANINADNAIQGMIVMMSGSYPIPDGWAICDGNNGTPDLRGRFIRMIGEGESTGPVNNSDLVTNGTGTRQAYLNGSHVPAHSHSFKTYSNTVTATPSLSASYNGSVSHNLSVNTSGLTVTVGNSNAKYIYSYYSTGTSTGKYLANEGTDSVCTKRDEYIHNHTASIGGSATISGGITLPSISISGSISVPINFTPEQDTDSLPAVVNVEPQAYALIFIMKL